MQKRIVIFIISLLAINSFAFASSWSSIEPQKFDEKVVINVSGNDRDYYPISEKEKVVLEIKGPTTLRILTRLALPDKKKKEYDYKFSYKIDGKGKVHTKKLKTELSKEAFLNKENVGQSRSVYLKVPAGSHSYEFFVEQEGLIYLRFFRRKIDWISFSPKDFGEVVKLVLNEREFEYYRINKDKYVSLEIIGPARVKAITRLEYNHRMSGERNFRIQLSEDNKVINSYNLTTHKSDVTTYKKEKDVIPSKGEVFYFDVPEGNHTYKLEAMGADSSVLFRFFIPQKYVKNSHKK